MTTGADSWGRLGLAELPGEMRALAEDARATFGGLTPPQLNWRPGAGQWSVGQCFEHLVKTHEPYVPVIEGVVRGERRPGLLERLSPLSGLWGRFVLRAVVPESPRKLRARARFEPSRSSVEAGVVGRFAGLQDRLADLVARSRGSEPEKVVIKSPVLGLVTYSLLDAYRIIAAHGRRHFEQARRVTEAEGFPHA